MADRPPLRFACLSLAALLLAGCRAAAPQATQATRPAPTATLTASAAPTASLTPAATDTPTPPPTVRPPTITPPPSELDDHPAKPLPVALEPGGFLAWRGSVEALVDEQDWHAIYVAPGPGSEVELEVELQCGGGDTARVGLFEARVKVGVDGDGDGRLSYAEALASGAALSGFKLGCLQAVSVAVPGGADYYLVVYAAFGGETAYALYVSR